MLRRTTRTAAEKVAADVRTFKASVELHAALHKLETVLDRIEDKDRRGWPTDDR